MYSIIIPAKAREYVFTGVCLSACLFVTTITKRLWTDLYQILWEEGSKGEGEDQVRVSLRSVDGCGSNGQKTP